MRVEEEEVNFSSSELKKAHQLMEEMQSILSTVGERFVREVEIIRRPPTKTPVKRTPLQEYTRKYK